MAKYHKTKDGTSWLEITWLDLMAYSNNPCPICDECGKDLIGCDHIALIPAINEAFCPKCGKATRVGFKVEKDEKVRVCKKCGEIIK